MIVHKIEMQGFKVTPEMLYQICVHVFCKTHDKLRNQPNFNALAVACWFADRDCMLTIVLDGACVKNETESHLSDSDAKKMSVLDASSRFFYATKKLALAKFTSEDAVMIKECRCHTK